SLPDRARWTGVGICISCFPIKIAVPSFIMSIRHRAARAGLAAALAAGSVLVLAHQAPTPSESIELDALRWRPLGPMVGGETTDVAGHAADPRRLYASSPGGGLWTTTDYGQSWQPLFDDQTTGVVTAVAVAPSDARRLFAGTGPAPGGRDQPDSATLFTSTDAGTTWARTGFQTHGAITRIVAHPTNPNALLITLLSPAGPDSAAGIY